MFEVDGIYYPLSDNVSHKNVWEEPFSISDVINSSIKNRHQVGKVFMNVRDQCTNSVVKNEIKLLPGHYQRTAKVQ